VAEKYSCFSCGGQCDPKSVAEQDVYFSTGMCPDCREEAIRDDSDLLDRLGQFREMLVAFQALGVISVNPWGVLLNEKTFRKYFGNGPDIARQDIGAGFIREAKIYNGTEFANLTKMEE
jgi:hypothetical protein